MYPGEVEDRRILIDRDVTLDGKPAVIGGVLNSYATVAQYPRGLRVEFAWPTIKRIVDATPAHTAAAFRS